MGSAMQAVLRSPFSFLWGPSRRTRSPPAQRRDGLYLHCMRRCSKAGLPKNEKLVGVRIDWSIMDLAWLMGLTVICLSTFGLIPIFAP
jgi:hypothetical protein